MMYPDVSSTPTTLRCSAESAMLPSPYLSVPGMGIATPTCECGYCARASVSVSWSRAVVLEESGDDASHVRVPEITLASVEREGRRRKGWKGEIGVLTNYVTFLYPPSL